MSRRSRKRKESGEKRWLGKAAVGLLVLGVVLLAAVYISVRSYLHSDAFRKFLSAEAGEMGGVTGEFAPFHWQGLAVDTDSFTAAGEGMVTSVRADGLHTEVGLGGLRRGVWEVRDSRLRKLEVTVDATKEDAGPETKQAVKQENLAKKSKRPSWFPSEAELKGADIGHVSLKAILDQGELLASGMSIHAEQSGGRNSFRGEITGGTIRHPFGIVPELRLDQARLRYQNKTVFLTKGTVSVWETGRIEADGEWDLATKQYSLQGDLSDVKCQDLLSTDWAKRLTGDFSSGFALSNRTGSPVASGKLVVRNGVLTALPVLDVLAAYADTRRFRVLTLNDASASWRWEKGEIALSNLVLSSEGLVRLEGNVILRGREIDGIFRLGLAPGTLSTIPGAETDVFLAGEKGLLWAPLRITGTLDDPKEDLTDRLVAAAGLRMFEQIPETGEKVIKFSRTVLGERPAEAIDKGVKIIEQGADTVRQVGGLLNGILGGSSAPEPEEEKKGE